MALRPERGGRPLHEPEVRGRIWPSLCGAYPGAVSISKTFDRFGQRDEPAIRAFGEALRFQSGISRAAIDRRARELGQP